MALPIAAPWAVSRYAIEAGIALKPKTVIPIHDGFVKDFALTGLYATAEKRFAQAGIAFRPMGLAHFLEM